jgi:hypothetical protein
MPIILILFFGSLAGIVAMIGKKTLSLKEVSNQNTEGLLPNIDIPDLEEIKIIASKKIKKHGYSALVTTLRFYIISSHFLKKTSKELYTKVKDKLNRNKNRLGGNPLEKPEVSKFLKRISEYKEKVRTIKHKIKKEENIE